MRRAHLVLLLLLLPLLLAASGELASDAVTASNLASLERFWPYRVALIEEWQPAGRAKPLRAGSPGVLIRVESPSAAPLARIDFSADGKYDVPVEKTDLVQNANRIRLGELPKEAPNFTYAIAARLVDSDSAELAPLSPAASAARPGFLCVFVDPASQEFAQLAAALAPLRDRDGVMTILFPQGAHPDAGIRERLRELRWTVPFLYDFLSEPYTSTLLAASTPMPFVLLQTNEGRVVFQREWSAGIVPQLEQALDGTFGGAEKSQ